MGSIIDCTVKVQNVPESVKNGLYGCWIVARYSGCKWWYFASFKDGNMAHECAKENDGVVFYYSKGDCEDDEV